MFLKRFVYVNWGNIPTLEFEFGPVNLFSGGNGSGKTTAADAIQTVMTAAHENLFQYNPGQDETTQRGRGGKRVRTLASYVLGCDDGSFARLDPSDGYLAAVFHPTRGESGGPFTAVVAVRAWLDTAGNQSVARQDTLQFFIIAGAELGLDHFTREESGERRVIPLTELYTAFIKTFGQRAVERYDTKKAYLRRLYGALRGRADAVPEQEAVAAARAFSRFMAYKPVQGIDRFVADEILEQKDLGEAIRSVSSQLKTIHGLERDADRLVKSIGILDNARTQSQLYIERWIALKLLDYTAAQAEYQARQQDYLHGKRLQDDKRRVLRESEAAIAQLQTRSEQLDEQLVSLEAQRLGIGVLRQKDELERQRSAAERRLVAQGKALLGASQAVAANAEASEVIVAALAAAELTAELPEAVEPETLAQAREVAGDDDAGEFDELMQRDFSGDLAALEARLEPARTLQQRHNAWTARWHAAGANDTALRDRLAGVVHERGVRVDQLTAQRRQKQQEITRLEAHQVSYPPFVERALAAIRQQCPKADPRVLCDHVEVKDPRWQAAIEGYVGGARFSILVEPGHEAEAIRIVRAMSGRENRARVIQGEKAGRDAERISLDAESIIHVLEFSHATARAYLVASYGSVLRVADAEALRHTRRGVTAEGIGSGNYSMFRCDLPDAELVFGAAARERALAAKRAELEQIERDLHTATSRHAQAQTALRAVDALAPVDYAEVLADLLAIHRELQNIETQLDQLDLAEHQDLEAKLARLKAEAKALRAEQAALNEQVGETRNELANLDKQAKALAALQEQNRARVEACEAALRTIPPVWPDFDVDARLDAADVEARDLNSERVRAERDELESGLHTAERAMAEALREHNQHCRPADAVVYTGFEGEYDGALFQSICALQRDIDRVFNVLKNNILVEKHGALARLKESFNNAFVTHLCHAIYQAINEGKHQIERLNKELQHHRFGADRETFRFASDWVPEYRDYFRFFEEVVKNPVLGDEVTLFEAELSERSRRVRDDMMRMLLDDDEQRALRDLERIADYRNYRRYEIYKEVEGKPPIPLSEYGTGSGGQLETPAYIIRAAAITSAFRFAEGDTHLRMVLVDEAFSKMDETRSREVIGYLTESLGLQLVFIMPTSKCGPFLDLISNEFVFAKVPSLRPRGQLATRVLVDRKECDSEQISALWARHRRMRYQQAELDFMEEFAAEA